MSNSILCMLLLSLVGVSIARGPEKFTIEGHVYCDTCRAGFVTKATEYIEGAKVKIECKNFTTGEVTQEVEDATDSAGVYSIQLKYSHEEEICEMVLVSSPREDCKEIKPGRERSRIVLTHATGISSDVRYGNALGFYKDEPLPDCGQLLQEYGLADELDDDPN